MRKVIEISTRSRTDGRALTTRCTLLSSAERIAELLRGHVLTPDGRLLAMLDYTGGSLTDGGADYFMLDDMKTVEALVPAAEPGTGQAGGDANPDAVRYAYEPYGQTIRSWVDPAPGTTGDAYTEDQASTPSGNFNPFGYVSGHTDKTTGLVKFGTRYYSPQLGTWTQRDPKNGELSNPLSQQATAYAHADPCNSADESGRSVGDCRAFCISSAQAGAITGGWRAGLPAHSAPEWARSRARQRERRLVFVLGCFEGIGSQAVGDLLGHDARQIYDTFFELKGLRDLVKSPLQL